MIKNWQLRSGFWMLLLLLFYSCSTRENKKPEVITIEISQMKFSPADLIIREGDSVIWINKDLVMHDVTALDSSWSSGTLKANQQWGHLIRKTTSYYCSIHKVMKGFINVQ